MTKNKEGILVFTSQETLDHKKDDGGIMFWRTKKLPMKFFERMNIEESSVWNNENSPYDLMKSFRLYMAVNGIIKGYFKIIDLEDDDDSYDLLFDSESYKSIRNGEQLKPSQGWRYYPKKESKK